MRAARFHDLQDLRIDEVPEPSPGPGEVKLQHAFSEDDLFVAEDE
jgi:(R,R)-butanediol dehydrogenase/meso-butanediol dehydrogenase/diacetyl reductase